MTRAKVDLEREFGEDMRDVRKRLEELGYTGGGHIYDFFTARLNLDLVLDDIESETGLRFREGDDGHAQLAGGILRITSKEKIPDSELEKIEKVV